MKRILTLAAFSILSVIRFTFAQCPAGYVERTVKCSGQLVKKCVPVGYTCKQCWVVDFPPCPNRKSGGMNLSSTYEKALVHANSEKAKKWYCNDVPWWDNHKPRIYLDDPSYCGTVPTAGRVVKSDLLDKINPFVRRFKDEITNYRRYLKGQPYKPGATFREYETQIDQAERNVQKLERMLTTITDSNLGQIESEFTKLQQEQQNLKQADANFRSQIVAGTQEEIARKREEQQLEHKRVTQQKIDAEIDELNRRSQAKADLASGITDGLGSLFGALQARQLKKAIAEDNFRTQEHFDYLKEKVTRQGGDLVNCGMCSGEGEHACNSCNATGNVQCNVCFGQAGKTCTTCKGEGGTQIGTVKLPCTSCSGQGVKNCTYCGNSGRLACVRCNGLGKYQCHNCFGTGLIFN